MKLHLSTLLMLTAIVCMATCLLVERRLNQHRTEALLNGSAAISDAVRYNHLIVALEQESDCLPDLIKTRSLISVLTLFRNQKEVDQFGEYMNYKIPASNLTAIKLAKDCLETLKCSTADEYFEQFASTPFSDTYADYLTEGTEEHIWFRVFAENAVTSATERN